MVDVVLYDNGAKPSTFILRHDLPYKTPSHVAGVRVVRRHANRDRLQALTFDFPMAPAVPKNYGNVAGAFQFRQGDV